MFQYFFFLNANVESLSANISYLTTDSAGVRFDPSVKPHVPGQHVTAGKTSLTNITKVSLKR